jgi:hypothetical protein
MKYITKLKLAAVHQICTNQDHSTEFTLQYMQDTCNVDLDCVLNYMSLDNKEHSKLFEEVKEFCSLFILMNDSPEIIGYKEE